MSKKAIFETSIFGIERESMTGWIEYNDVTIWYDDGSRDTRRVYGMSHIYTMI